MSCAPDGTMIPTFVLWILSPTLYQLSHPVTPYAYYALLPMVTSSDQHAAGETKLAVSV